MTFDFEAFKQKYINDTGVEVFVGNAAEIRSFITTFEETQAALEEMSKELKIANNMIKELKDHIRAKSPNSTKKAPYDDPND
ncbi:hypothetical protein [Neobacillus drentensis]|uniref:hypothetical protein n=1 Tax=Neobacillus drentensis TaxID=220684 RepID=UPI002FFF13B2